MAWHSYLLILGEQDWYHCCLVCSLCVSIFLIRRTKRCQRQWLSSSFWCLWLRERWILEVIGIWFRFSPTLASQLHFTLKMLSRLGWCIFCLMSFKSCMTLWLWHMPMLLKMGWKQPSWLLSVLSVSLKQERQQERLHSNMQHLKNFQDFLMES